MNMNINEMYLQLMYQLIVQGKKKIWSDVWRQKEKIATHEKIKRMKEERRLLLSSDVMV